MTTRAHRCASALGLTAVTILAFGCGSTPLTTSVGKSVATLVKTNGWPDHINDCSASTPTPPNPQASWNALPPDNHKYPFAGFQLYRNGFDGCLDSRVDVYRALVTFNMASVSNLKGLVQKAELVVAVRAMPDSAGGILTIGPPGTNTAVNATCPNLLGGGGSLHRFGPAAAATLPAVSGTGMFSILTNPALFPSGNTVYTFPAFLNATGPVSGATNPTTVSPNGLGGSVFTTDVTSQVNAALNGAHAGMSWMLTSVFEGPLPAPMLKDHNIDCRTSYNFELRLTHL